MLHHEFLAFLKEYKIVSLAIAFVMGTASTDLIHSFVNDVLMPIISPIFPHSAWQTALLHIGPIKIAYGSFLGQAINFLILALVVFLIAKKLFKEEKKAKN